MRIVGEGEKQKKKGGKRKKEIQWERKIGLVCGALCICCMKLSMEIPMKKLC